MIIVKPSVELVNPIDYKTALNTVELAIRNCYQSYDKMTDDSAEGLIRGCISRRHHSPLEFLDITVKLVCDRGLMAQITRHRLASFCIQSTRYCNYSKERFDNNVKFIVPEGLNNDAYDNWVAACRVAESAYMVMINDCGMKPEVARSVLPNSTATTIYMKANAREWRHIFNLRISSYAQEDIRKLMQEALNKMHEKYPVFFYDLF